MKLKKLLLFLFITSYSIANNINNSVYHNAKSPRINALGGSHFISDNISDIFYNPIRTNNKLNKKIYCSYFMQLDNLSEIFQFNYNLSDNKNYVLNFGFIVRKVDNIFNTAGALSNYNNPPEYSNIDYNSIYSYNDEEVGLLFSYNKKFNDFLFNVKCKPNFHFIDTKTAYGIDFDIYINRNINNINLMFGYIDFSYKKWKHGTIEKRSFYPLFSASIKMNKSILAISSFNNKIIYGLEHSFLKNFIFRVGLSEYENITFGFGINVNLIELNYACFKLDEFDEYLKQYSLTIDVSKLKDAFNDF